jgi:uncharacterized NAD(P)/FAD-binding protein YdhS
VAAIHLARISGTALDIEIIEPRDQLGAGLAYGSCSHEHRLNVPADRMSVFRDAPSDFADWLKARGEDLKDPDGRADDGHYSRRAVFGLYLADLAARTAHDNRSGSTIRHRRTQAETIYFADGTWRVALSDGHAVYDQLILAVTHSTPSLPWPKLAASNIVEDPWVKDALAPVPRDAHVAIAGSGLTMCDAVVSLRTHGHRGRIDVISRRGLTPRPQNGFNAYSGLNWREAPPASASRLLHDLRQKIRAAESVGGTWQEVLNAVRDQAPGFWPKLSLKDRARILRYLRPYWDVHRFRAAPQISALLERGEREGWLHIQSGRIHALQESGEALSLDWTPRGGERHSLHPDIVINCTGPHPDIARSSHAILRTALKDGFIRRDALGLGIDVDLAARAIRSDGTPAPGLWIAGPMARTHLGDATGLPEVSDQARLLATHLAAALAD